MNWLRDTLDTIWAWLEELFANKPRARERGWFGAISSQTVLLIALALCAVALAFFLVRHLRRRRAKAAKPEVIAAQAVAINIEDETLTAEQLAEDEWFRLAAEFLQKGDLRSATRANFLGTLAHLGSRQLISLQQHKTNHDYEQELGRRTRQQPEMQEAFRANSRYYDWAWYGLHLVDEAGIHALQQNFERIRNAQS